MSGECATAVTAAYALVCWDSQLRGGGDVDGDCDGRGDRCIGVVITIMMAEVVIVVIEMTISDFVCERTSVMIF